MPQKPQSIWEIIQGSQLPQMNTLNPNYVNPYANIPMAADAGTANLTLDSQTMPTTQDQISESVSLAQRSPASVPEAQVPNAWQAPKGGQVDPYAALMGQQEALIRKGMNERKADIEYNAKVKDTLLRGFSPQLDISPLLAYADKLSGGNSLQAYKRPEDLQNRMGQVQTYAQALERQRNGLSDDEMNLLRMKLGVQQHKEDASLKRAMLEQKQNAPLKLGSAEKEAIGKMNVVLQSIDTLEKEMGKGMLNETSFVGFKDTPFTIAARSGAENFGRLQSGGAISKPEEDRFLAMLPSYKDTPEVQRQKIRNMREQIMMRKQLIETGKDTYVPGAYSLKEISRSPATAATLQVGEVRKGYKYNGGDPSNPESWSKQ